MAEQTEKEVHSGHRERMRERFLTKGAAGMASQDVLEILLYQSIPRADTAVLAAALLKKFGSFSKVLGAPVSEMIKVEGIGMRTAQVLHMLPALSRFYMDDLTVSSRRIYDVASAYEMMRHKFAGRVRECVMAMILDSRGNVMYNDLLSEGSISQVPIYVRDLVQLCIHYNADALILGHNHTSGSPVPSKNDIVATKEIQLALDGIYVSLEDHIIFAGSDYASMRKSGWLTDVTAATELFRKNMLLEARRAEEELEFEP